MPQRIEIERERFDQPCVTLVAHNRGHHTHADDRSRQGKCGAMQWRPFRQNVESVFMASLTKFTPRAILTFVRAWLGRTADRHVPPCGARAYHGHQGLRSYVAYHAPLAIP